MDPALPIPAAGEWSQIREGIYGSYVGEVGTWTDSRGCTSSLALNTQYVTDVNANESWYGWGVKIPGVHWYYYMGGPGADPSYSGTANEAYTWGEQQAALAFTEIEYTLNSQGVVSDSSYTQLIFADVEPDISWQDITNCSYQNLGALPAGLAYQTWIGFCNYLIAIYEESYPFIGGTYSASGWFNPIVSSSANPGFSWTYESDNPGPTPDPVAFTQSGQGSAQWFGGYTSGDEVAWQWTQNGGDYDQWDTGNVP
jgi:hypothetical protein